MVVSLASTGGAARVFCVNGGGLTSKNAASWIDEQASDRKKRKRRKDGGQGGTGGEGEIRLIQDFDFPEASNKVKTTRDGRYAVATGTYKPRLKVWELDELAQKTERVTDSENVDFCILSQDWTKTIHLQADRSLDVHNQSSSLYRVRIPRHGRALAYHFPTCDAVLGGQGAEVWRVNLELGRFMRPLGLEGHHEFDGHDGSSSSTTTTTASGGAARGGTTNDIVTGVNAIDINPAHQLLAFGTETANARGTVELWDPRARSRAGLLRLPYATLMANSASSAARSAARLPGVDDDDAGGPGVAVSALASRSDGLNFAVGTSTGHTLLYDLRANRPYTIKDQGYGLPVKKIEWTAASYGVGSGDAQAQGGYVATADEKVVKIWGRETGKNLLTVTPPMAINDMHIYPDSGLMLLANEGAPMTAYYCPQLGQAPKWCRFLDNMTDDMDDEQEEVLYDDFKFIDGSELDTLNLGHLLGTPALKPYLHGYFVDLRTYTKARAIANPFQFAEYRERLVREKLEREKDSRIRAAAANSGTAATAAGQKVKVNKALAARARLAEQEAADATAAAAHEAAEQSAAKSSSSSSKKRKDRAAAANDASALLQDSRFADLFTNPDFEIDERSREYALMHPSESAQQKMAAKEAADASDDDDDEGSQEETEEEDVDEEDEEQEGEFEDLETGDVESEEEEDKASSRKRPKLPMPRDLAAPLDRSSTRELMVGGDEGASGTAFSDRASKSFGQRVRDKGSKAADKRERPASSTTIVRGTPGGGMEMSFIPSERSAEDRKRERKEKRSKDQQSKSQYGAGLESKRDLADEAAQLEGEQSSGRQRRRRVERSASRKVMRQL